MNFKDLFTTKKKQPVVEERTVTNFGTVLPIAKVSGPTASLLVSGVFRAVDLISDSVAMLPIKVVKKDKESEQVAHELDRLFEDGLLGMNKFNFIKFMITNVLTKGNAYAYIIRKEGKITGLRILEPETVSPQFVQDSPVISFYLCSSFVNRIYPQDMIHLVRHVDNAFNGKSNTYFASRSVKSASAAENLAARTYEDGNVVKGVITADGSLSRQQKDDVHASWNQSLGNQYGDGIAVLQGNMKFQSVQATAMESQLLQSRQYDVVDIARFFGISPVLLGDLTHSSWASLEVAQQDFILHCLQGWIIMVEEELTKKLLSPSERENLKIDLDEKHIIKTDKQALANYYATMLSNGILSVNEVRQEMGLNPIEGGDKHVIPFTDIQQNQIENGNKTI